MTTGSADARGRESLLAALDLELVGRAQAVPRHRFEGRATLDRLVAARTPAIVEGALTDWPALSRWTLEHFAERWGGVRVHSLQTSFEPGRSPYDVALAEVSSVGTMAECVQRMRADDPGRPVYLNQKDAESVFPGSTGDLAYDTLVAGAGKQRPSIWLGTRGTRSGLHWDALDNVIAMVRGAKTFLLAPPGGHRTLYASTGQFSKSCVDPGRVDWARFPRLRRGTFLADVLRRGEVLFLPRGWWHYFAATELSINASLWFGPAMRPRLFRQLGLAHVAAMAAQFLRHGVLKRPYQRRALCPPPPGLLLHRALRRWLRP